MNITNNRISFYLPHNPEHIRKQLEDIHKDGTGYKLDEHIHKYFYIIDIIYLNKVVNNNTIDMRLNSQILKNLLGNYYTTILKDLLHLGIIEKTSNYRVGKSSNGYGLCGDYNHYMFVQYDFDSTESSFLIKLIKKKEKTSTETNPPFSQRLYLALDKLEYGHIDKSKLTEQEKIALDLLENNKFQVLGKNGGRIFNNFTNLPKTIRKHLRINGEKLFFVDISNSQIIFLASHLKKVFSKKKVTIEDSSNRFFMLVEDGKIYEELMGILNNLTRDKVKEQMFLYIFGENHFENRVSRLIKELFPQVDNQIREIKENDYRSLSHILQKEESKVIFYALNLIDEQKSILTIHDSLYCAESDKYLIIDAIMRSFKHFEITGTVNINDLFSSKSNTYDDFRTVMKVVNAYKSIAA